jgi:hypothetical protein
MMAGCAQCRPLEIAESNLVAGMNTGIRTKALATLPRGLKGQLRSFPVLYTIEFCCWNEGAYRRKMDLQNMITAAMI